MFNRINCSDINKVIIVILDSTQDCFKASWSSHKSVHVKAKLLVGTGTAGGSDGVNDGWLYCMKRGQARDPKLPYFNWTGYF